MAAKLDFWERSLSEPFEWGKNDCALWVSSFIYEKTGLDPAQSLRGTYTTGFGALRVIHKHGGLEALGERYLGHMDEGDDVGVVQTESGALLCGIRRGDNIAFKTADGLLLTPFWGFVRGWAV